MSSERVETGEPSDQDFCLTCSSSLNPFPPLPPPPDPLPLAIHFENPSKAYITHLLIFYGTTAQRSYLQYALVCALRSASHTIFWALPVERILQQNVTQRKCSIT
jgi:hypothetical protein